MKKKGFTLIELLAVIAILGLLVVLTLPNVIKMYNKSRKQIFVTELHSVLSAGKKKVTADDMVGSKIDPVYCKSQSDNINPLDLDGQKKYYYTEFDDEGDIKRLIVWDKKQYIRYSYKDSKEVSEVTIDDIVAQDMSDVNCQNVLDKTNLLIKPDKTYTLSLRIGNTAKYAAVIVLIPESSSSNLDNVRYVIYRKNTMNNETTFTYFDEVVMDNKSNNFMLEYKDEELGGIVNLNVSYKVEAYTEDNVKIAETSESYEQCFVAGTKVFTEDGYKNIEDIKVGEKVYSYNLDNNELELKEVKDTIISSTRDTYKVTINDKIVEMSPKHQVYIVDKGWIRAYDLKVGDKMLSKDNKLIEITNIEYKIYDKEITTYNLTVDGNNNYYVTDIQILVHNLPSVTSS